MPEDKHVWVDARCDYCCKMFRTTLVSLLADSPIGCSTDCEEALASQGDCDLDIEAREYETSIPTEEAEWL